MATGKGGVVLMIKGMWRKCLRIMRRGAGECAELGRRSGEHKYQPSKLHLEKESTCFARTWI